jgi:CspA family cold shock protein
MLKGTVKWFSSKGQSFGYISREDGGEIFVHFNGLTEVGQADPKFKTLVAGQLVEFEEAPGHYCDGTQAVNVRIISA